MSILSSVRDSNDLGHPICDNLRQGDWMAGYTVDRLKRYRGTTQLALWFESVFLHLKELPRYLVPCYFEAIITAVFGRCLEQVFSLMSR